MEYGITEILGNEIDEELRQLRADYNKLCDEARYQGAELCSLKELLRESMQFCQKTDCDGDPLNAHLARKISMALVESV